MKKIGLTHFRFSISWSRILPKGTKAGGVNRLGINFYNNVIDELLANDIQPFVTLFHWDVPHALEEAYGSFLSNNIVLDFVDFANICFKEFGDRVKKWVTITKPNTYAQLAYASGDEVPNRCSHLKSSDTSMNGPRCFGGNSATEPYIVAHNLLLSHASIVALYRQKYQASQNGTIGITVACNWVEPYDFKPRTVNATKRYFDHSCGWFLNPLTFGDYPETMHSLVGNRLPKFTADQSVILKNSFDFLGLDYYTAFYIQEENATTPHYDLDDHAKKTFSDKDGMHLGKKTPIDFYDYPTGLENITLYLQRNYNNPVIIVTANGYASLDGRNKTYSKNFYIKDSGRIEYIQGHIDHLHRAIKSGANVKGYIVSSFMDSFEWNAGYIIKYGLIYIDHKHDLKRYKKNSAKWYRNFLRT
ncbi:beta-glucosidase 17-like [Silene latifolia]|uniref:beta-glucosidase 17-like n=1 Tax=Silene latifolia TaxID=37657 RepID=UPI003D76EC83